MKRVIFTLLVVLMLVGVAIPSMAIDKLSYDGIEYWALDTLQSGDTYGFTPTDIYPCPPPPFPTRVYLPLNAARWTYRTLPTTPYTPSGNRCQH